MRIAMMSAWNTDSGVALHAEPIGKELRKMGHKLTVFSFIEDDFHGDGITASDEDYVVRCFGTQKTNFLDPRPILSIHFDIFIVQDLRMLPVKNLAKIFPLIKKRARTVHIVHENELPKEPWFYQFDWDLIIYFDKRQDFLKKIYPDAVYIPFPCFEIRRKDKLEARKRLDLPMNKKLIYCFAQRGYHSYLRDLPEKLENETLLLHVVSKGYEMLEGKSPPSWMIVRQEEPLSQERFDEYLFASDALILHKFKSRYHALVSSTAFQALGCGCPIFVPEGSDFFYPLEDVVVRYRDIEDLKERLCTLLEDKRAFDEAIDRQDGFALMNSPKIIADRFIGFFTEILRRR
ncbi:MAG: hypothetical protein AB1397_03020 [bacterium]